MKVATTITGDGLCCGRPRSHALLDSGVRCRDDPEPFE